MPIRSGNFGDVWQMLNVEKLPIDGWIDKYEPNISNCIKLIMKTWENDIRE